MGFLDSAGLSYLWGKLKAGLGLKMDKAAYDPTGKARDVFGYADALKSKTHSATLASSAWRGSSAPYTQTVSVSGLTATANGEIGLSQIATAAQRAAAREAMLCVTGQAAGSLTVTADGTKPAVNIPITVTLLG